MEHNTTSTKLLQVQGIKNLVILSILIGVFSYILYIESNIDNDNIFLIIKKLHFLFVPIFPKSSAEFDYILLNFDRHYIICFGIMYTMYTLFALYLFYWVIAQKIGYQGKSTWFKILSSFFITFIFVCWRPPATDDAGMLLNHIGIDGFYFMREGIANSIGLYHICIILTVLFARSDGS